VAVALAGLLTGAVPQPVRDEEHSADPGEHRAQCLRGGFLQAIGHLRDAHDSLSFLTCPRDRG
jgi:hypothetical protein